MRSDCQQKSHRQFHQNLFLIEKFEGSPDRMSSHSEVASRLENSYYPPSSAFLEFVSSRRPNLTWGNFDLPADRIKKNCYLNAMYFISQNFSEMNS